MKKLWYSYTKELKLASKTFYFYVEFVMAILIIFILLVIVPDEMSSVDDEYLYLEMPEKLESDFRSTIMALDLDGEIEMLDMKLDKESVQVEVMETEDQKIFLMPTLEAMVGLAKADRPSVAAHIWFDETQGELGDLVYEYYLQGYESDRLQNLYRILHTKDLRIIEAKANIIDVRALEINEEVLNTRQMAVPSLLAFNGSLMGLFIIAAYIFLDKQEGVIKAYAVTASKMWHYLMSKILVATTVTIITTVAITLAVMGTRPNYLMLLIFLVTTSFAGSSLGLFIASFYDSMTKAFAAVYAVMMVLMMPAIAYFIPSWQPLWIKLIPTHYLIQGFKDIVMNTGDMSFVWMTSIIFLGVGIILFIVTEYRFKKNLAV